MSNRTENETMLTITAAEFKKQFGRYREAAQREPVAITSHGRESVILLSAAEYARLLEQERQAGDWSSEEEIISRKYKEIAAEVIEKHRKTLEKLAK